MTTRDVLAAGRLPRHECERLLMLVTGATRAEVVAGLALDDETAARYTPLCKRRVSGEPLQYIEGYVSFGGCEIAVDRRVLIPRPETEYLWELAAGLDRPPAVIVDLCTGSGALAVALAGSYPEARVVAADLSVDALDVARSNAASNHVDVELHHGDLFDALPDDLVGSVDLFVANPPYVSEADLDGLPAEVRDWEPAMALVAGLDGLDVLRRIAADLDRWLAPDGRYYIEIGEGQSADAADLFAHLHGSIVDDLAGRPRYVAGRR